MSDPRNNGVNAKLIIYFVLGFVISGVIAGAGFNWLMIPALRKAQGAAYVEGFKAATQQIQGDLEQVAAALRAKKETEAHWYNLGVDKAFYDGAADLLVGFRNNVTAEMLYKIEKAQDQAPQTRK